MIRRWKLVRVATFPLLVAFWSSGFAGYAKSGQSEIELGDVPHFADEASALAFCKPDGVVWADRKTGFYYPKFFKDYGKTEHGTYTCYNQAVKADYWSPTPASSGGHKGREFPQFFCYSCT
jgi:hypothetical protein